MQLQCMVHIWTINGIARSFQPLTTNGPCLYHAGMTAAPYLQPNVKTFDLDDDTVPLPWEQWEGESDTWYERFHHYLMQGPRRSIKAAHHSYHQIEGRARVNPRWFNRAAEWRWKERAQAWDSHSYERIRDAELQAKLDARNMRRSLLTGLGDTIQRAMPRLEKADFGYKSAIDGIKVVTEGLRQEFDELPTSRSESTITVKVVHELTQKFVAVFLEVNQLPDAGERQRLFSNRLAEVAGELVGASSE